MRGNSAEAIKLLNQSLEEAQQISNVQLQIRTLQQLSNATLRHDVTHAAAYATDAIRLARENRLDSWAAIGLVRLAAAQLRQGDLKHARDTTNEGLRLAHETKQLRVEALANAQLANLENQDLNSERVITAATAARDYYQKNGFYNAAGVQSLLIGRAERGLGRYDAALKAAEATQALAAQSGERDLQRAAEELIGTVYQNQENYPAALLHFQRAQDLTDVQTTRQYESVMISEMLLRLGRYQEFENQLRFEPSTPPIREGVREEQVQAEVSTRHFSNALASIDSFSIEYPELADDFRARLIYSKTIAEANTHQMREALKDLALLKTDSSAPDHPGLQLLASAEVKGALGDVAAAEDDAHRAAAWYRERHLLDSELRSVALEARLARTSGHLSTLGDLTARCVDIVAEIGQTSPPDDVKMYLSRPDIKALLEHQS